MTDGGAKVPVRNFRAYRRKIGETIWLYVESYFYEIDSLLDLLWRECDGEKSVEQIGQRLAEATGVSAEEGVAQAEIGFSQMSELDIIHWR